MHEGDLDAESPGEYSADERDLASVIGSSKSAMFASDRCSVLLWVIFPLAINGFVGCA